MPTTQKDIKSLRDDLDEIKNLLADQIDPNSSNGHSKSVITREQIAQLANQAGQGVRTFVNAKSKQLGDARNACEETIKARPFAVTAAAFVGGAVLMSLLKRK